MEDREIIELFFSRNEQGIRELDIKYGGLCRSVAMNILSNHEDSEECVSSAYFGAWNSIPPEKPDPLSVYISKIVRNIALKMRRSMSAAKRTDNFSAIRCELDDSIADSDNIQQRVETKELAMEIEQFLDRLSEENCVIFVRRYYHFDTYEKIAGVTGLSEKNVSVRLVRIRKQLRNYLAERGYLW